MEILFGLLGIFPVVLVVVVLMLSVRIVKQQNIAIVESFGKFSRTLEPGINFLIPVVQTVAGNVNLRIQEIKANVEVKTSDNAFVHLPVAIQLMPNPENAEDAFYKLQNPEEQITSWILNSVRSIASKMTLEELFTDKDRIIGEITTIMLTKLNSYGYFLEAVLIDQPAVEAQMQHSFNRVIAAKREAEAAEQEGIAARVKIVANANAEAESQRLRAQGLADARKILAEGLAKSVEELEKQHLSPDYAVSTLVELSRLDVMREVGNKGNTIIFDMNKDITTKELAGLQLKK